MTPNTILRTNKPSGCRRSRYRKCVSSSKSRDNYAPMVAPAGAHNIRIVFCSVGSIHVLIKFWRLCDLRTVVNRLHTKLVGHPLSSSAHGIAPV